MAELQKAPLKISIITLGCKVNQCESESLYAECALTSLAQDSAGDCADICVINTCTVTGKASMQSRQAIRKAIRENPEAVIIVTGCYAQSEPEALKKIQGIHYIFDNTHKQAIPTLFSHPGAIVKPQAPEIRFGDIRAVSAIAPLMIPVHGHRTRPFIRIQDGCDNFCSYCIVPYTRGPSRSLPAEEIFRILENPVVASAREIVLTGIHLGRYGRDLTPVSSLLDLLNALENAKASRRIRLSSIEPPEISPALIAHVQHSKLVCPHFHVPLQNGDAAILSRMNRHYTPAEFTDIIRAIRQNLPAAAIGVDIMVGFPGETEAAFGNTVSLLEALPVTYLHVFPFSPRPGTRAAAFPDPVDPRIVKKRRDILLALGREKKSAFHGSMTGKTLDVLIEEKRDPRTGLLTGISENYVRVLVPGADTLKNRVVPCRITGPCGKNAVTGVPWERKSGKD